MSERRSRNLAALAIFAAMAATLFVFHANRWVATNDEGMIPEPAQRILAGARPYSDFFAYMSPGSYWLQALIYRVFGVAMWTSRAMVIFDLSLECALVFWIISKSASRGAGIAAALIFAGFQLADPSYLTSAHRWDSAALALAGIAAALSESRWRWLWCGVLLAASAWCTPALAMAGAAVVVYLAIRERREIVSFAGGAGIVTLAAVGALAVAGNFGAFLAQLAWLRTNYAAVNVMPYGSVIGGYRALFEGTSGVAEAIVRGVLVGGVALPAVFPVLAIVLAGWVYARASREDRMRLELLGLCCVAITATVFPRADVAHLIFIEALPLALCAIALARLAPARVSAGIAMAGLLLAAMFGSNFFTTLRGTARVASAIGELRVEAKEAPGMEALFARVRPGQTMFVYPYMPMLYVATQAKNPTRFSYLAPGMMTDREASAALDELRAHPAEWLMYLKLPREEFLRVFPNATGLDAHFEALEAWMNANYEPVQDPAAGYAGYRLYRFRSPELEARH